MNSEHGEPVALGLVKSMKCYKFIACLYMTSEVLPHLSRLSRLLQSSDIDLTMIMPSLQAYVSALSSYQSNEAPDVIAAHAALNDSLKVFAISMPPLCKENFNTPVHQHFLQALQTNIENRFAQVEILNAAAKGKEKLTVLTNHYRTGEDAPVNCEDL